MPNSIETIISELQTLQIRQSELLLELESINRQNKNKKQASNERKTPVFKEGDRVRIINRINKYLGRIIVQKDRVGTVTKITQAGKETKVHILTDNHIKTWRYPRNLAIEK